MRTALATPTEPEGSGHTNCPSCSHARRQHSSKGFTWSSTMGNCQCSMTFMDLRADNEKARPDPGVDTGDRNAHSLFARTNYAVESTGNRLALTNRRRSNVRHSHSVKSQSRQ